MMSPEQPLFSGADAVFLDLLPDPVIGFDAERRIVLWNRAAEQTYGFSRSEAVGQRPAELLSIRFPLPRVELVQAMAEMGEWKGELLELTKDGRELTVETHWLARYDDQGNVAGGVAIHRDITARLRDQRERERGQASAERERLQGRMLRSQRLESIGELAGGIAHDFNNLLAVIINYAMLVDGELAAVQRASAEERWTSIRGDVGEIRLAAERAARLTHQLLTFARQDVANPVAVDINGSIRRVEELLQRTLGDQVQLVTAPLAEDLQAIRADPAQLEQVLVNLAVNGRDAMPDGGTLTIDTANVEVDAEYAAARPGLSPGAYVRLRVSDTGSGMAPEVVEHAFDPFFTTKPVGQGTGLGLATVYGMIRQARGHAEFYSEPGLGTTFTALFPATQPETSPEDPPPVRVPAPTCTQTILLVEDEDALREVTRRILTRAGYQVVAVSNGSAAVDIARTHAGSIDLLLTDVVMPGMLGQQLAVAVRELRPSLPVLYMSGFAGSVLAESMNLRTDDLIEKPFTARELLGRISMTASAKRE